MKKLLGALLLIIGGISAYYLVRANPIPLQVISELAFTPDGWILEIKVPYATNTGGWHLVSKQDSASLKDMALEADSISLITTDSLMEQLRIDSAGDDLKLYSESGALVGYLNFGVLPDAGVAAPKSGQSVCMMSFSFAYLDNTPTLGYENDTVNTTGHVAGYVTNNSLPLKDVKVTSLGGGDAGTTNSAGYFIISSVARKQNLTFAAQNFTSQTLLQQVWPESTVTVNLNLVVSVEKLKDRAVPRTFIIGEPFPNPFNPETQVQYSLSQKSDVVINAYDISGKLVDKIFSGLQSGGSYQARWNAAKVPSGVYIIQIRAGQTSLSKKCVLVK